MALFKVTNIVDGNTIEVEGWEWGKERKGKLVQIVGYEVKDKQYDTIASAKLITLVKDKSVELKNPINVLTGKDSQPILMCSVYLNDIDIAKYFPEFQSPSSLLVK